MTEAQATEWYCTLTGTKPADIRWTNNGGDAIENIQKVANMVERAGGELKSRQVIATIIQMTPQNPY